ncbi:MAG: PAS domain S-box protein, partial [Vibrio sp.]
MSSNSYHNASPEAYDDEILENKNLQHHILKRFLKVFSLISILLFAIGSYTYKQYTQSLENRLLDQEEAFVATMTNLLQKEMHVQLLVLHMVARSPTLSHYLETKSPQSLKRTESLFTSLADAFQDYAQVRIISAEGKEVVRVEHKNGKSTIIPQAQLQDKKSRYYFRQAMRLKPGESYVSKLDLNVENGKLEIPYQPTIRLLKPIFNAQGTKLGVLVINYSATELLENFRNQIKLRLNGQGMLIDPQGYWLSNHDRSNEWGLDLGQLENHFKKRYPDAWPVIAKSHDGVLKTDTGLFRYQSVEPLNFDEVTNHSHNIDDSPEFTVTEESIENTDWKLVIFLPNETIQRYSIFHKPAAQLTLAVLYLSILVVTLLLITFAEQRKFRRRQAKKISTELKDLYENAPCGYHSIDGNGIITRINQTELNWLGYHRDEVIGKCFSEFLTPAYQKSFKQFLAELPEQGDIDGMIFEVQTKSGDTFFVSSSAMVEVDQGNFVLAKTSSFDITDRIELEKRLEHIAHTDVLTGISNRRHFFEVA